MKKLTFMLALMLWFTPASADICIDTKPTVKEIFKNYDLVIIGTRTADIKPKWFQDLIGHPLDNIQIKVDKVIKGESVSNNITLMKCMGMCIYNIEQSKQYLLFLKKSEDSRVDYIFTNGVACDKTMDYKEIGTDETTKILEEIR